MLWSSPIALALLAPASLIYALPADPVEDAAVATITAPPEEPDLAARTALGTTAPWVSVDDEGRPAATLTPFMTTDREGVSYLRDAAPHDLTATVFTFTSYGKVSTSTGDPPNPTATNKNKQGGFPVCENMEGNNAPICAPSPKSTLFKDTLYYVTWDPEFYNKTTPSSNSTVEISLRLDYFNRTAENSDEGETLKLDETERVPASWGLYVLNIKGDYLKGYRPHNITITLMTNDKGSAAKEESASVNVLLDKHHTPDPELSTGAGHDELVIALPVVFGSILFIAVGLFLWNRKTRKIGIANIMSRTRRHGYTGRSARKLLNRVRKDDGMGGIPLEPREHVTEYRDNPADGRRPRRDSDLGSLTGSPTEQAFGQAPTYGGRDNAFREELRRQDEQRRQGY